MEPVSQLAEHCKEHAQSEPFGKPRLLESQRAEDLPVHLPEQPIVCGGHGPFQFVPPRCTRKRVASTDGQCHITLRPVKRQNGIFPALRQFCKVPGLTGTRRSISAVSINPAGAGGVTDNLVVVSASASSSLAFITAS